MTTTVGFSSAAQCIDVLEGLQSLASGSVACTVTSPPYNIGIKYSTHQDRRSDYLPWIEEVCKKIRRVTKDDGHFFLQVGDTSVDPLISNRVLGCALSTGWMLQNKIVWAKNISIGDDSHGHFKPINSPRFLNQTHEYIFHLTKAGDLPIDRLAIGVSFVDKANIRRFDHQHDVRCRGNTWFIPYETVQSTGGKYHHPAIFPVLLPEMCIRLSGIATGSLVLDPFVGSGSTLVACERLGMLGMGFDIDAVYVETANRRIAAEWQKLAQDSAVGLATAGQNNNAVQVTPKVVDP
jgi:site-specific DNA-methyltransferase (adenine-specific)